MSVIAGNDTWLLTCTSLLIPHLHRSCSAFVWVLIWSAVVYNSIQHIEKVNQRHSLIPNPFWGEQSIPEILQIITCFRLGTSLVYLHCEISNLFKTLSLHVVHDVLFRCKSNHIKQMETSRRQPEVWGNSILPFPTFCFCLFVFSITFCLGKNPFRKIHFEPLLRH